MKSIVVEFGNKTALYCSGSKYQINEAGEQVKVEETEKEQLQSCYESLIRDIRREEFEKVLVPIILRYLNWDKKDVKNIKILVDGTAGGHCEMNMRTIELWDKEGFESPELPQI